MGILSKLISSADDAIYKGLGKTISPEILRQKLMQGMGNVDDAFVSQNLGKLFKKNIKIRNAGGGGTPYLQDFYAKLMKK